ncbi:MAG: GGDEF domain-containing protein [Thalassospira sp.]|nr:EAL domain-containing protein [Thalassospira profundimaris WP0211]MBE69968.1 GGDEF domain-containing protein [Thalassospira sp.]
MKIGVLHLTFDADEQWISDRPMTQPVMLRNWQQVVEKVDFAFQPIVSPHTGHVFGYEALLRRWEEAGFTSIQALFDTAWDTGNLHSVDMMLRAKAIEKFARFPGAKRLKLFYNFDNRVVKTEDYQPGQTAALLSDAGLERDTIFLEISERHDISNAGYLKDILVRYRSQGFKIAIDDYGSGFAQLRALYECEPDIIKIDRFFIDGIDRDRRKELFVTQITAFAHMIAAQVVAEGVETREEFLCCRRLGCDLVQGFFIARPSLDIPEQTDIVSSAADIAADSRRQSDRDDDVVRSYLLETPALPIDINPVDILSYFQQNPDISLVPVVDHDGKPLGIVRDSEFKAFIYTPFGRELLQNPANRANIKRFLRRCPVADIRTSLSELLETFVATEALDGVILTENDQYLGVLDQSALLRAVNERNTLNARDENPLTRLPGNSAIYRYAARALAEPRRRRFAVYFDFDNFKPFNDQYGFRQGDRAILLFKDILGKVLSQNDWFVGHIGGDDFFAYVQSIDFEDAVAAVQRVQAMFDAQIKSFYDPETRESGYLTGKGRDGKPARFDLMSVSAALIRIPAERTDITLDHISVEAAKLKALAKTSPRRFAAGIYDPDSNNASEPKLL